MVVDYLSVETVKLLSFCNNRCVLVALQNTEITDFCSNLLSIEGRLRRLCSLVDLQPFLCSSQPHLCSGFNYHVYTQDADLSLPRCRFPNAEILILVEKFLLII